AEVKGITSEFHKHAVVMKFEGWDRDLKYRVDYTLAFSDVSLFEQRLPEQEYVEAELGDLGYWECELVPSGIEVRMLFVSSAEFRIVFSGFSFEHSRREA